MCNYIPCLPPPPRPPKTLEKEPRVKSVWRCGENEAFVVLNEPETVKNSDLREVSSADFQPKTVGEWARWAVSAGHAYVLIDDDGNAKIIAACRTCGRAVAPLGKCPVCGGVIPKDLQWRA